MELLLKWERYQSSSGEWFHRSARLRHQLIGTPNSLQCTQSIGRACPRGVLNMLEAATSYWGIVVEEEPCAIPNTVSILLETNESNGSLGAAMRTPRSGLGPSLQSRVIG